MFINPIQFRLPFTSPRTLFGCYPKPWTRTRHYSWAFFLAVARATCMTFQVIEGNDPACQEIEIEGFRI